MSTTFRHIKRYSVNKTLSYAILNKYLEFKAVNKRKVLKIFLKHSFVFQIL